MSGEEPFESDIERVSPEVTLKFIWEGKEIIFACDFTNTKVRYHVEDYDYHDHIWMFGPATPRNGYKLFRDRSGDFAVGDHLAELGFPMEFSAYPSIATEMEFHRQQSFILGRELLKLEYGGLPWEEK